MSVRQLAEQDIKDDLQQHGKCFIAFQKKLDPYMEMLVNERIREQVEVSNKEKV